MLQGWNETVPPPQWRRPQAFAGISVMRLRVRPRLRAESSAPVQHVVLSSEVFKPPGDMDNELSESCGFDLNAGGSWFLGCMRTVIGGTASQPRNIPAAKQLQRVPVQKVSNISAWVVWAVRGYFAVPKLHRRVISSR